MSIRVSKREIKRTEGSIPSNPLGTVHPAGGLSDKRPDVVMGALRATIEVLAGEFGHPDGAIAGAAMVVFDVAFEVWEPDVVPMDGNDVRLDGDLVDPIHDPNQAVGCRGGRRRGEDVVTLVGEGGNIRVPHPDASTNVHKCLTILVDPVKRRGTASEKNDRVCSNKSEKDTLIHAKDAVCVAGHHEAGEVVYLFFTPEHGAKLDIASVAGDLVRRPGIVAAGIVNMISRYTCSTYRNVTY